MTCRNMDEERQEPSFSMRNLSPMIIMYKSRSSTFSKRLQQRGLSMMRVMTGIHRTARSNAVLTTFLDLPSSTVLVRSVQHKPDLKHPPSHDLGLVT